MKNSIKLLVIGMCFFSSFSFAQKGDSVSRKNVIKYNITSPALYGKAFLFQYERVLNNHRSISLQVGHVALPELLTKFENIQKIADAEQTGFNVTVDYRFYLAKENKYSAPRGVYIAPFASIHNFKNVKEFEIQSNGSTEFEPVVLDAKVNILSAGVALGYQFVLWDRMTLDFLVVGPSVSNYNVEMALDGDIPVEELDENLQEIIDRMSDKFPFFDSLLEDKFADFNGRTNFSSMGFRYSVGIGFRF
jgi:hypothetical protein